MPWAAWRAERPWARGPPGPWHIPGHRGDDGGAAGGGVIGDPRVFFVPFLSLLSFRQRTRNSYCCRQEKSISLGQQIHLGEKFQSPALLCVGHEIVLLLFSLGSACVCPRPGGGLGEACAQRARNLRASAFVSFRPRAFPSLPTLPCEDVASSSGSLADLPLPFLASQVSPSSSGRPSYVPGRVPPSQSTRPA